MRLSYRPDSTFGVGLGVGGPGLFDSDLKRGLQNYINEKFNKNQSIVEKNNKIEKGWSILLKPVLEDEKLKDIIFAVDFYNRIKANGEKNSRYVYSIERFFLSENEDDPFQNYEQKILKNEPEIKIPFVFDIKYENSQGVDKQLKKFHHMNNFLLISIQKKGSILIHLKKTM